MGSAVSFIGLLLRSLGQRRRTAILTALATSLSVMMAIVVLAADETAERRLARAHRAPPLIVGAATSPLGLVLATVFFSDQPTGLLSRETWKELEADPSTRMSVPLALGDSFRGYPVVATTEAFFSGALGLVDEETPFLAGRAFAPDGVEAVVGADVATALELRIGDRIEPAHGGEEEAHEGDHLFEVVGILTSTRSDLDRTVVISLEAFWALPEHVEHDALSGVYVVPKAGMHHAMLASNLRKRPDVVVAETAREIVRLERYLGSAAGLLAALGGLVLGAAWLALTATIWATTRGRLRELALLRMAGAARTYVAGLVVAEGAIVAGVGAAAGWAWAAAAWAFLFRTEVITEIGFASLVTPRVFGAMATVPLAGGLAGALPALEVYRRDPLAVLRGAT